MKRLITRFYHETALGSLLMAPIAAVYRFIRLRLMPEKMYLARAFERRQGDKLNIDDPKTLNEKIQWLKIHDRSPLHTLCADKVTVRDHIKGTIGEQYLVPIHFTTTDPDDIRPENLPEAPFVVKTNNDSGGVLIVMDKDDVDWPEARRNLARIMKTNYYYRSKEYQYKHIKPAIIVEHFLTGEQSSIPFDYKYHCFNGKCELMQVDIDRHGDHRRNLYDTDWNLLDFHWHKTNGIEIQRPKKFEEMIALAETLADGFRYVRVDFYSLDDRIYFGEMTFHPASGYERFYPWSKDLELGGKLDLNR